MLSTSHKPKSGVFQRVYICSANWFSKLFDRVPPCIQIGNLKDCYCKCSCIDLLCHKQWVVWINAWYQSFKYLFLMVNVLLYHLENSLIADFILYLLCSMNFLMFNKYQDLIWLTFSSNPQKNSNLIKTVPRTWLIMLSDTYVDSCYDFPETSSS